MATFRELPYSNMNFLVDLGTGESEGVQAGFSEVIMPAITINHVHYRNGNDRVNTARKIPTHFSTANVILKRGIIGALDLAEWVNQTRAGSQPESHRNVTIQLLSEDRSAVAMTWRLVNARPEKYSFGKLEAIGDDVAIELLELCCEDVQFE